MADNTSSILGKISKQQGAGMVVKGDELQEVHRIPTGVFAFDLASGGGFPIGKFSIVYGPNSSGKTNLVFRTIANYQKEYPEQEVVFFDVENSFDANWSRLMGIDISRIHVVKPDYAEQVVDQVDALLTAEDIGLIIVDSLAAMVTIREADSSAEKANVGGNSVAIQALVKKIILGQSIAKRQHREPTVICINQIRNKIGVMFGDPETMPGGKAMEHGSGLTVRIYGKNEIVKENNPNLPTFKDTSLVIKKNKVPIVASKCEYKMTMIPYGAFKVGDCDDFNTTFKYMKEFGYIDKGEKSGWMLAGVEEPFKTLTECREHLEQNPSLMKQIQAGIINDAIEQIYKTEA